MIHNNEEKYRELIEAVRPFFPNNPVQAYSVVTERIGPIFNQVLLQLVWRQLELELTDGPELVATLPYEVFVQRLNMN
jgi:hypothetical protein